ncbi:MAG: hypothetical protein M1830_009574 [Pleopsidium flavum]|nr:MAG: hypothetical protein M1830_009574 [Pleopsidium flavum]
MAGWGYTSYNHMVTAKYLKTALMDAAKHQITGDYNLPTHQTTNEDIKTAAKEAYGVIGPLFVKETNATDKVAAANGQDKVKIAGDNYLVSLLKLQDIAILELSKAMEGGVKDGEVASDDEA